MWDSIQSRPAVAQPITGAMWSRGFQGPVKSLPKLLPVELPFCRASFVLNCPCLSRSPRHGAGRTMNKIGLEDFEIVRTLKNAYAPDQGDEKWHNGGENHIGFGLLHYALIRNLRPDNALAVGSRYGFVPACIALGLKANGKGRLTFVD